MIRIQTLEPFNQSSVYCLPSPRTEAGFTCRPLQNPTRSGQLARTNLLEPTRADQLSSWKPLPQPFV